MFDEIVYTPAVGDFVWHNDVRFPVRIAAMYDGPLNYCELEIAGTRFTALTSTLTPVYP